MTLDTSARVSESRRPKPRKVLSVIAVIAVVAVAGCWIVTQIQTACEASTRDAFFGFTHALNDGDADLADEFFADNGFSWYSEDPYRLGGDARDRDSLLGYLQERVEQDARLRVLFFDFNSEHPEGTLGQFGFYAVNDSWELISGKGAAFCDSGGLTVLSTGSS